MIPLVPIRPYRFDLNLKLVARFTYPVVDRVGADTTYWRVLRSPNGGLGLWRVHQTAEGTLQPVLMAQTGEVDTEAARRDLAQILAIDYDPRPFFDYARSVPALWEMIEPLEGMRWLRTPTVFEALIAVIIEQHIAWVSAQRSQLALVQWAGNIIRYEGRPYYAYPTPEQLAAASPDDLKEVKVTTRRKALMIDLAGQVASGTLDIEALRHATPAEAYAALMALPGIGHWSAAFIVTRALGTYSYIPDADVALQAAANFYFNGATGKLTAAQTRALYTQFGNFAGSAAFYTLMRRVVDKYEERV
jgi:DNA-3-methyladenine glycosylase II